MLGVLKIRRLRSSPEVVEVVRLEMFVANDVIEHGIPSEDSLICSCYWKDVFSKKCIILRFFFFL